MTANVFSWKKLLWFCLGLFLASLFCMKWMEDEFIINGKTFSIMDLELYFDQEALQATLAGLDDKARTIVGYHLHFDFFFMAGVFPGIASICMLVSFRIEKLWVKIILFIAAALQLVAWSFDIYENLHLIKWLKNSASVSGIELFHWLVRLKFMIAFGGIIISLIAFLFFRNRKKQEGIAR